MTAPVGVVPPLHRKFNEQESLEAIRNRYRNFQRLLGQQVAALQADRTFLTLARRFYDEGYKDWHILAAVFNLRLNWETRRLGIDQPNPEIAKTVSEIIERTVEPVARIVAAEEQLESMFVISDVSCLKTYGFEPRRADVCPEALERFLRYRMRHYDLDLPHPALFGDPPGEWPSV